MIKLAKLYLQIPENIFISEERKHRKDCSSTQFSHSSLANDTTLLCSLSLHENASLAVPLWKTKATKLYFWMRSVSHLARGTASLQLFTFVQTVDGHNPNFGEKPDLKKNLFGKRHESSWRARSRSYALRSTAASVVSATHQKLLYKIPIVLQFCSMQSSFS